MPTVSWLPAALVTALAFAAMLLALRRLGGEVAPVAVLTWLFALGAVLGAAWALATGTSLRLSGGQAALIGLATVLSVIGNVSFFHAIAAAPNPGLPVAIEGSKAAVVLLAAAALWGDQLTASKLAGTGLCVAGVVLISRSSAG